MKVPAPFPETGPVTSVTPQWNVCGLFYVKFCDQTVAFLTSRFHKIFQMFLLFSLEQYLSMLWWGEREVCSFYTACYI